MRRTLALLSSSRSAPGLRAKLLAGTGGACTARDMNQAVSGNPSMAIMATLAPATSSRMPASSGPATLLADGATPTQANWLRRVVASLAMRAAVRCSVIIPVLAAAPEIAPAKHNPSVRALPESVATNAHSTATMPSASATFMGFR